MEKTKTNLKLSTGDVQTKISNYTFTMSASVLGGGDYVQ